jgi:hypothetical protein
MHGDPARRKVSATVITSGVPEHPSGCGSDPPSRGALRIIDFQGEAR